MQNLIDFIISSDTTEFTPQAVIGIIVFTLILECISSIASSLLKAGGLK